MVHEGSSDFNAGEPRNGHAAPPSAERFPRALRLTKTRFFQEAYAGNERWVGRYMVLWLRRGEDAAVRLGVVSSKKVGNAVRRNRARRRLREIFRRHRTQLVMGAYDLVLVARYRVVDAPWDQVVGEFLSLAGQAGILARTEKEGEA
ncbi:MAG: ribonuclease P protein component [Spartobacteria bacterium]|nr:ribonuclease P protein component [Spartobacteria bacterium]